MTYLTLRRPTGNPFRFYSPFFAPQHTRTDADRHNWAPSVDISETDNGFEVRAELPGDRQRTMSMFLSKITS